ncbi:MAG: DUF3108 domain-containing protein [Myxococcales bacterium]|nr:DUF3108 domain-containing protein [Myxococcales bacterium]
MLRTLCTVCLIALGVAACGAHPGSTIPLVDPPPTPLPSAGLQLPSGEQMVWDIYWQGLLVGRADLGIGAREAHSKFSTTALAKAFARVRYQLSTTLDHGAATASHEGLTVGGEDTSTSAVIEGAHYAIDAGPRLVVPGGTPLHTLHTTLASLRAWSREDAPPPAYLWFVLRHTLYRLDVERPTRDEAQGHRALKIRGTVRPLDRSMDPVDVTIWLSTTADRTPLRFVVVADGERVSAELTETTATVARN